MTDIDKWSQRRLRHCKQYGLKNEVASEKLRTAQKISEAPSPLDEDDSRRPSTGVGGVHSVHTARSAAISRTQSLDRTHITHGGIENITGTGPKRESVLQIAYKGINAVMNGDLFRQIRNSASSSRHGHSATVSRIPTYISVRDKDRSLLGYCSFPSGNGNNHRNSRCETVIQYGGGMKTPKRIGESHENSIGPMAQPTSSSTNFDLNPQDNIDELNDDAIFDVLFFEPQESETVKSIENFDTVNNNISSNRRIAPSTSIEELDKINTSNGQNPKRRSNWQKMFGRTSVEDGDGLSSRIKSLVKFNFSIRKGGISSNSERSTRMPIYGRFISDPELIKRLKDDSCDYRPYFTYWICTVHVVVLLAMLLNFGIGTDFNAILDPLGVIERSGDVMTSSLSAAHIVVWEQNNIWIGPKYADLVHVGAKYTPCMRRDDKIYDQILQERRIEAETTGCCIGPWGCYQTSECPKQFAQLLKTIPGSFPEGDHSRVVCGQDPRYCVRPRSVHPVLWGQNISNWPICEQNARRIPSREKHMHCRITGRPCCIQMHGQCRITSREYCDFVGGSYHPNATLCSQVSCLNNVCGMTSFFSNDYPNQYYRLITPLFIHAGIIRCAISLGIYLTIMRRFEIMIGWSRLSTIYFVSGIGGYLASAVFIPYMPEVGPAGSEGGVLGALIVNIVYNWDLLTHPWHTLLFHFLIAGLLFILGFLPWIDNWAQVFGFFFGCLMAIVLIPYITLTRGKVSKRLPIVIGSLCITVLLFIILIILFINYPFNGNVFALLNCPFTTKICDHQGLILRNWLPI